MQYLIKKEILERPLPQQIKIKSTLATKMVHIIKDYVSYISVFYYVISIDCTLSLGMITVNILTCVDSVLIPIQATYLLVKDLEQLMMTIRKVGRQLKPRL